MFIQSGTNNITFQVWVNNNYLITHHYFMSNLHHRWIGTLFQDAFWLACITVLFKYLEQCNKTKSSQPYHWPRHRSGRSLGISLPRLGPSLCQGSPSPGARRWTEGHSVTGRQQSSPGAPPAALGPAHCCPSETSTPHPVGTSHAVMDALKYTYDPSSDTDHGISIQV